jgi:hypothetical protein
MVKIGSSSQSSFATELTHGVSNSDKANPPVSQGRSTDQAGRSVSTNDQTTTPDTAGKRSGESEGNKANIVSTPIGVFDLSTKGPNKYIHLAAMSEMRAYFMTHQPADWMNSDKTRAEFAKIYGEKALVTLDWDGTVPENIDPVWVTKRAIGPDGRPLPASRPSTNLT